MAEDGRSTLTTTSYAILGQLAMRPWTMYELARQMRANVHGFFPRAESQIYAEPKRLLALGLAAARHEATGRRRRTVYSITEDGRRVLSDWLATPLGRGPLLEFEGLLRVFLAGSGRIEDLKATLEGIRAEAAAAAAQVTGVQVAEFADAAGASDRIAEHTLVHDFVRSFVDLIDGWAGRSLDRIEAWSGLDPEERAEAALATLRNPPTPG